MQRPYTGITAAIAQSDPAKKLDTELHLQNSIVLSSRVEQLRFVQENSICIEVGVYLGDFSKRFWKRKPQSFIY